MHEGDRRPDVRTPGGPDSLWIMGSSPSDTGSSLLANFPGSGTPDLDRTGRMTAADSFGRAALTPGQPRSRRAQVWELYGSGDRPSLFDQTRPDPRAMIFIYSVPSFSSAPTPDPRATRLGLRAGLGDVRVWAAAMSRDGKTPRTKTTAPGGQGVVERKKTRPRCAASTSPRGPVMASGCPGSQGQRASCTPSLAPVAALRRHLHYQPSSNRRKDNIMIRKNTVVEKATETIPAPVDLVPLSALAAEGFGWGGQFMKSPRSAIDRLARQLDGAVHIDDLGRRCTDRDTARALFAQRAEVERIQREQAEQQRAERARRSRPAPRGVPVPEGLEGADALTVMKLADSGAKPGELDYHRMPDPDAPRAAGEFYQIHHVEK